MDNMHYEPAMKAIEPGYHLLLEKPAAKRSRAENTVEDVDAYMKEFGFING